jgi:hypothetical protein
MFAKLAMGTGKNGQVFWVFVSGYVRNYVNARLMVKKDQVEKARKVSKDFKLTFSGISSQENSEER